eukprot:3048205-Pyramimonas_sp.AAC.1
MFVMRRRPASVSWLEMLECVDYGKNGLDGHLPGHDAIPREPIGYWIEPILQILSKVELQDGGDSGSDDEPGDPDRVDDAGPTPPP